MRILLDHCLLSISISLYPFSHKSMYIYIYISVNSTFALLFFFTLKIAKNLIYEKPYLSSISYSKFTRSTKMIYKSDLLSV